jgi:hypothetical protein
VHCPLAGPPHAFATKLDGFPPVAPALRAPAEARMAWQKRLGTRNRCRIGIACAADPAEENARRRSAGLKTFAPLLEADAIFVALQKELPPTTGRC